MVTRICSLVVRIGGSLALLLGLLATSTSDQIWFSFT